MNELAPDDEGTARLAQLYARGGELEKAQAIWSKMASGKGANARVFQAIDNLLTNRDAQTVVELTNHMVRNDPRDWEALYRSGSALAALEKPDDAIRRFQALLSLTIPDDEKSAGAKARARNPRFQAAAAGPAGAGPVVDGSFPLQQRISATYLIRYACNLDTRVSPRVWSPDDFGQARMAALGWLLSYEKQGSAPAAAELAAIRQSAEKSPPNLRARWDRFYLCELQFENAALFEAARALARSSAADPVALWAYLQTMGGRNTPSGDEYFFSQNQLIMARAGGPNAAPLDQGELDYMMACYHTMRARRPELASSLVLINVADELKRAGRTDQEERFYREAVAGSTQLEQVAGALVLAARRGDVAGLRLLFERYDRVQTGRARPTFNSGSFSFSSPGLAICQGMSVLADRKDWAGVLGLADFTLIFARKKQEQQSPGAALRALRRAVLLARVLRRRSDVVSDMGRPRPRSVSIAFPQVNEYFDSTAIQVLRNAYELYVRDDLTGELVSHFRRQLAGAATPRDRIYPGLALGSLYWWSGEKEKAIDELGRVVEHVRAQSDLRLEMAELEEQTHGHAAALAIVDAFQPLDNGTLRRREELALRLAASAGDIERARRAAERLFGLRLDTETQVRLAGHMHQLGQHALADAVLGRARRRAGGKLARSRRSCFSTRSKARSTRPRRSPCKFCG